MFWAFYFSMCICVEPRMPPHTHTHTHVDQKVNFNTIKTLENVIEEQKYSPPVNPDVRKMHC